MRIGGECWLRGLHFPYKGFFRLSGLRPECPAKLERAPTASAKIPTATNIKTTLPTAGIATSACSVDSPGSPFEFGVAPEFGEGMPVCLG